MIETLHGVLSDVPAWEGVLLFGLIAVAMAWAGADFAAWVFLAALALFGWGAPLWAWVVLAGLVVLHAIPPVRRVPARLVMKRIASDGRVPALSRTESESVDAGGVGIEAGLFSGHPDLDGLAVADAQGLSADERSFLDGPLQAICESVDEWDVRRRRDLAPGTWALLAQHRAFALRIPREYGGHGFSASGTSAVITRAASASPVLGGVVSAANTFASSAILVNFGTKAQQERWLPDLAQHKEIAAIALDDRGTNPDPGLVTARGEVIRRDDDRLGLRLSWDKCFVALSPVATVLVVVFRMRDARNLLGKGPDPGITCALVPVTAPGVRAAERHEIAGGPFPSGTSMGEDVLLDLEESVIGGVDGVGAGWRMLTDCLVDGWGLAAVSMATGSVKQVARVASAHAVLGAGIGNPLGRVDGGDEAVARIAGTAYALEAARRFISGALDAGVRSGVLAAILTRHANEAERCAMTDGLGILGPNGISLGPDGGLAQRSQSSALSTPVPGSGFRPTPHVILGMAAFRCHPYLSLEIEAVEAGDVRAFDRVLRDHFAHFARNGVRALLLGLTRGWLAGSPVSGPSARYWRRLAWASASFAFWADLALMAKGGRIRKNEALVRNLAEIHAGLVMTAVALRRFVSDGRRPEDLPFLRWSAGAALARTQAGFESLFDTLELRGSSWFIRGPVAVWARLNRLERTPSATLSSRLAAALRTPGPHRERLLGGVHTGSRATARLERALALVHEAEPVHAALREAVRLGRITRTTPALMLESALLAGVITRAEVERVVRAGKAGEEATRPASFTEADYFATAVREPAGPTGSDGPSTGVVDEPPERAEPEPGTDVQEPGPATGKAPAKGPKRSDPPAKAPTSGRKKGTRDRKRRG